MGMSKKYVKPCKHGHSTRADGPSATYRAWCAMVTRCTNKNQKQYKDYGGRGITYCDKWQSFEGFLDDMGVKPEGLTLGRVDNDKGYSKDNCRWATWKEQGQNNRHNRIIVFNGRAMTLQTFSDLIGLKRECVAARIRRGWSIEKVANVPIVSGRPRACDWDVVKHGTGPFGDWRE